MDPGWIRPPNIDKQCRHSKQVNLRIPQPGVDDSPEWRFYKVGPPTIFWDGEVGERNSRVLPQIFMLVGGLEHKLLFFHILGIIIPIDSYFSGG